MQVFYDKKADIAYIHFASSLDPELRKELKFVTPSWKVKKQLGRVGLKIYLDDCAKIVGFEFAQASYGLRPEFLDPASSDEQSNSYDAVTLQYDPEADAGVIKLYSCQKSPYNVSADSILIPAIEAKYGVNGEIIIDFDKDNYIREIEILWISKCIRDDTMRNYACEYDFDNEDLD